MLNTQSALTLTIFIITILFLIWRPRGLNEAIPTSLGAACIFILGTVDINDIYNILEIVTGASITIISTIIMSIVLESVGFFRWTAFNLAVNARGSGIILFWYILLLCFLMTMFFNNDGSILITTPIIIQTLAMLKLKPHQKIPYLLGGALIATAASAPIGVSNLANLIALKIVGLDLNTYAKLMFLPSMVGLFSISLLLFIYFKKDIPKHLPNLTKVHTLPLPIQSQKQSHPLSQSTGERISVDWKMFQICMIIIVAVRGGFFALSHLGIPIEWLAILGALLMIFIRWYRHGMGALDVIKKTPWYILVFAFSMYVIIYGLHNVGFTSIIVENFKTPVSNDHYTAILLMGILLTVMSNLFNNLPSVMLGTLALTEMGLNQQTLQVAYLANIIGSDVGSLIMPMGTLATLIWMFILKQNKIPITWKQYLSVTLIVIPIGLLISLLSLYFWTEWLF